LTTAATAALTVAASGNRLLAGGNFRSIGGVLRSNIAILDATTGEATAWKADANDTVMALAVTQGRVYAGGVFTSISGSPRNRLAALSSTNGAALNWNPGVSGRANSAVNASFCPKPAFTSAAHSLMQAERSGIAWLRLIR
jgi:hypothetical protein